MFGLCWAYKYGGQWRLSSIHTSSLQPPTMHRPIVAILATLCLAALAMAQEEHAWPSDVDAIALEDDASAAAEADRALFAMKVYLPACQQTAELVIGRAPYDIVPNTYKCFDADIKDPKACGFRVGPYTVQSTGFGHNHDHCYV
jgi:hypothetical protein